MPCNAMHPIQDLFLEGFSFVLQIDMHFICTPMWTKFYSCKKWVLQMFIMFFFILGEYQNIIDKHHNELVQLFHEYFVHQVHEVGRSIG
jgi:hypothetical protein